MAKQGEMKKIEALIEPCEMERVKNALIKIGIQRMTISQVDEFESQKYHKVLYRGNEYMIDVVKEFKIELIVTTDELLSQVIEAIEKNTKKENIGDREIFVSPVEQVIQLWARASRSV
jgi:nitrogen regulatory protein PII